MRKRSITERHARARSRSAGRPVAQVRRAIVLGAAAALASSAGADTVRVVPLASNRIAYNPVDGMIYATTPGTNSITIIDPVAGTVGASIPMGESPVRIAVSNTGRYVYVGFDADGAVRRFDTRTQTVDLHFLLGVNPPHGPMYVDDIKVMPGNENTVAISRRRVGVTPRHQGVGIYDNGVPRPTTTLDHTGANVIVWSSPTELFGLNNETSSSQTYRLSVNASGVSILHGVSGLISGVGTDIKYANGFLYSTNGPSGEGHKIDGGILSAIGSFLAAATIEPDPGGGRLFTLAGSGSPRVLRAYDIDTLAEAGTLALPQVASGATVSDLVRWGDDGLAFRTGDGQVVLVNTPLVAPSGVGACCLMDGTCGALTLPACSAGGGLWQGLGTGCAAANCPQPGACCMPDGSCAFVAESACGGAWGGAGVTCDVSPCPQPPTGACCLDNFGVCVIDWASGCASRGGLYRGDGTTCASSACSPYFEVEPNASKAEANSVVLQHGQPIVGVTNGIGTTAGSPATGTVDYFRVRTTPAAPGIYRHRLTLNSSISGHSAWIRGLSQDPAVARPWPGPIGRATTNEHDGQTHRLDGTGRVNTWYGFGREEEVYYRVSGATATTAQYVSTLETTPVTPQDLGAFNAGVITIDTSGQGHNNLTHLRVYDGQFDPVPGYANDDASINGGAPANLNSTSYLRREYGAGVYYMAVSIGNLATDQGAACDDDLRNGAMMDFPNVAVDTGTFSGTNQNVSFSITHSGGTTAVPASRGGRGEIAWFRFTVTGTVGTGSCCFDDGTCAELSLYFCGVERGVYGGDGTTCTPNPCPQPGACCLANGSCHIFSAGRCAIVGGDYFGNGSACGPSSCPPASTVVVPATHAVVAGTSTFSIPLNAANRTYQFVIAASELGGIAPGSLVNGLAWRLPPSEASQFGWPAVDVSFARYDIEVATSLTTPATMSTTYAGNIGPDVVMVRSGALTIPAQSFPGGVFDPAANPFGFIIPFTTPFIYNGGDMVVTIRHGGGASRALDSISGAAPGLALGYGTLFRGLSSTNVTSATGSFATFAIPMLTFLPASSCYANCDGSTAPPALNVADFTCFLVKFAGQDLYANCDGSTVPPVLNVADFTCFLQKFAGGCP